MRSLRRRRLVTTFTLIEILSMPPVITGDGILDWLGNPFGSLQRSFQTHRKISASARDDGWRMKQNQRDNERMPTDSRLSHSHFTDAYFDGDDDTYDADHSHLILSPVHPDAARHDNSETMDEMAMSIEYDSSDAEEGYTDQSRINPASSAPTIVYRFYGGKSTLAPRTTRFSPTAIPIVCMGPNVDHWKPVAQELSSRGFNVIVCERVKQPDQPARGKRGQEQSVNDADANAWLIRKLLDALRWNQVVLVGCDSESLVAIQAAMRLAPQRVVGLVLCGNLDTCTKQLLEHEQQALLEGTYNFSPISASTIAKRKFGPLALDGFLYDHIKCPFRIVSDATAPSLRSMRSPPFSSDTPGSSKESTDLVDKHRCHIIGGGTAPHRRRPEQFAWTLSRFVEELITPGSLKARPAPPRARGGQQPPSSAHPTSQPSVDGDAPFWAAWQSKLSEVREKVFSPFSFTVGGRMVASAIFYTICLKVAIYQFDNFRVGVNTISLIKKRLVGAISSVFAIVSLSERDSETATDSISKNESAPVAKEIEHNIDRNDTKGENDETGNDESDSPTENGSEGKVNPDDGHYRPSFFLDNVIA